MKTRIYFTILTIILSCTIKLSAQTEWAPTGAKWYYEFSYNNGNAESYITIESIGDTVIDGISCKILQQECIRDPYYLNRKYYTYKNDDQVWLYDGSAFRLLYDFSIQPQDEWTTYGPSLYHMCDTLTNILVDSVGYEELNGLSFKYMIVSFPEFGWNFSLCGNEQTRISEKFGSYGFMFPQEECGSDIPAPCMLRCYEDSEFGYYSTGVDDSCTYEYGVGIKDIMLVENVKIGPNPVKDILSIELKGNTENSKFWIYNATGGIVTTSAITNSTTRFDMSQFKKGTYIVKIYYDGIYSGGKVIKM
jgi:hypothetical protein